MSASYCTNQIGLLDETAHLALQVISYTGLKSSRMLTALHAHLLI